MPQRKAAPTITLRTPDAMGDDSFIVFRKSPHAVGSDDVIETELERYGVMFDANGKAVGGELTPTELSLFGSIKLAQHLVDWNWVDDQGNDLPKPDPDHPLDTVQMFKQYLRDDEIEYLTLKLRDYLEAPGNSKRSSRSSKR